VYGLARAGSHRFLSASGDCSLRLWDIETGKELRRFEGHGDAVSAVVPVDSRRALSASRDRTLRLWDVEGGCELRRFEGHEGPVISLVALDGRHAVSGSGDNTLRLWDLETGVEMARFDGDTAFMRLAVMPDGTLLARDVRARLHRIDIRLA
jgi:WD40 repeat protein